MSSFVIHFVDLHHSRIDELKKRFSSYPNVKYTVGNVKSLPVENTAFVSPSNSFLFMDSGVDKWYSREMFPGVEQNAKALLKHVGITTGLGRFYLPVGSAITVPVGISTTLVCAPTMFLPQKVSSTNNAYYAFMAALCAFEKSNNHRQHTLVCPPMCTGWGEMPGDVAAEQMYRAYVDFTRGIRPEQILFAASESYYITQDKDEEQPSYYENTEIKEIDVQDIVWKNNK